MSRIVAKGLNYTKVITRNAKTRQETVQFWKLSKERKPEDCGVWKDGSKIMGFEDMESG